VLVTDFPKDPFAFIIKVKQSMEFKIAAVRTLNILYVFGKCDNKYENIHCR